MRGSPSQATGEDVYVIFARAIPFPSRLEMLAVFNQTELDIEREFVEQELARLDAPVAKAAEQIRAKVRQVHPVQDEDGKWRVSEGALGVLSTGEKIAVAMVVDRYDLIRSCWGTMLEAVDRLGDDWTMAALRVQSNGWNTPTS